ncbi:hypothetical protein DS746_0812 [Campylobacter jejuni]|nr:hypothetical protein DS746_0812 [Campylobacter jejuni]
MMILLKALSLSAFMMHELSRRTIFKLYKAVICILSCF